MNASCACAKGTASRPCGAIRKLRVRALPISLCRLRGTRPMRKAGRRQRKSDVIQPASNR
jgi:hypothetical protein